MLWAISAATSYHQQHYVACCVEGTVLKLGTDKHHQGLLRGIDNMESIGCFALTELGFGNNAVEMQTTANYDAASQVSALQAVQCLTARQADSGQACFTHMLAFASVKLAIVTVSKRALLSGNVRTTQWCYMLPAACRCCLLLVCHMSIHQVLLAQCGVYAMPAWVSVGVAYDAAC